jgi:signal transduction histidine kinase/ActR/RegA family two-component response regulator
LARNRSKVLHELLGKVFRAQNLNEVLPDVIAATAGAIGAQAAALILSPGRSSRYPPAAELPATPLAVSSTITYGLPEAALEGKALATELLVSLGMQEAAPVVVGDYPHYVFAHSALVELGVRAVLASPLEAGGEPIGLLVLLRISDDRCFGKTDAQFVQMLSMAIGGRIENLRLRQLGRDIQDEAETVQRTSSALTASLELPEVLDSILASAHDLVPADSAHIFLYDGKELSFGAASGQGGRWDKPYAEPRREGLTYRVAESGQPIVVEDIRAHPIYKDSPKKWGGSIVGLPLKVKQGVVGVMNISRFEPRPFMEKELRILQTLADQAAIAVENARLYDAERTQRRRIEAMQSAVASVGESLELPEVLDRILTELRKVIPFDSASVLLLEGESLRVVAGRGLPNGSALGKRYPVTEIEREIERTGRPFILLDASADDRFRGWGNTGYVRGWMSVPLLGREGLIGCLTIDSRQTGAYSDEEADLAMSFAHQAAIAVENAQLHKSVTDQLEALKTSQDMLVQSEKLAAIGKLVAGVAHELNNPLTAIIGIAQLLQSRQLSSQVNQDLDRLVSEAHRAGKIVRSLLDFSRQQRPERHSVIVEDVLDSTLKILAYELQAHNVECRTHFAGGLPETMADANQLQQVFVNLINNACEAMYEANGGGVLTVSSKVVKVDPPDGSGPSSVIRVCIGDNGPGIPAHIRARIFDPPGKGTGLGLSVCHGIVSEHGGRIWVESQAGEGSRFCVQIPVVSATARASGSGGDQDSEGGEAGIGRVLVVEDEEAVRDMLVRVLKEAGYQTDTGTDGLEAMEKIKEKDYDLIICDVRMPRLNGIELYRKLNSVGSEAGRRTLFITGDTISPETIGFIEENGIPYLGKPFEIDELLEAVQKELKRARITGEAGSEARSGP